MQRVVVIHWHEAECIERAERIAAMGFSAVPAWGEGGGALREALADPPAAVVIDLGRLPSHGRHTALALRERKATRAIPIVFVDGEADKVARVREMFADATFTTWRSLRTALRGAIARPPADPIVPRSTSGAYSGTPLPKKLGIKSGSTVAVLGAPPDFASSLAPLPDDVALLTQARRACDVIVLFCKSAAELQRRLKPVLDRIAPGGSLWIAWPKKASGVATDLSDGEVRRVVLATEFVDTKVCAIDETWSGLRFQRRRPSPH